MDPVTGAAVMVGLSTVGGPAATLLKDFLGRVLTPPGEAIGTILAHPIVEWQKRRVERAAALVEAAAVQVANAGAEPNSVPSRLLMPILEKGSLEEDGTLAQKWTNLLARAATGGESQVLPAYVQILGEMSPKEVAMLDHLFSVGESGKYNETVYTFNLIRHFGLGYRQVEVHGSNFARLGIWRPLPGEIRVTDEGTVIQQPEYASAPHKPGYVTVAPRSDLFQWTLFGIEFMESCKRL